jgi:hypothetical protein
MTLLQIVQEFCQRNGLTVPQIVMASQDDQLTQIVGLANEVCEDLVRRHSWTILQYETVFTSAAGADQGALSTLAPNAFLKILNETIFDRTRRLPVFGPRSPQQWQMLKALPMSGPFYQYRIQQDRLLIIPDMPSGHTMAFEYASEGAVQDVSTVTPTVKAFFTRDDDVFLLNKSLLLLGLRWRWKEEKGLPYLESFRLYEAAVAEASGADGTKQPISMNEGSGMIQPGVFVPAGNWSVS